MTSPVEEEATLTLVSGEPEPFLMLNVPLLGLKSIEAPFLKVTDSEEGLVSHTVLFAISKLMVLDEVLLICVSVPWPLRNCA